MSVPAERNDRTVAVENVSYRWAYAAMTYALLLDVMYRSLYHHEAAWDLMALVVASGAICSAYQARQKTLAKGWVMKVVLGAVIAIVAAFIAAVAITD
jgi:hypothetical protein